MDLHARLRVKRSPLLVLLLLLLLLLVLLQLLLLLLLSRFSSAPFLSRVGIAPPAFA